MALIFFDGFDAADAQIKWSSFNGGATSTTTRYSTGRSWQLASAGHFLHRSFTAVSQVFVGFAYLSSSAGGNNDFFAILGDSGVTTHLTLRWSADTTLGLYRGGTAIATATVNEPNNALSRGWAYIEVSATIADSGGTCVVKVNGSTVINFTGDTRNAGTATTIDAVRLMKHAQTPLFDDVYILDSTGSANNTFLGEQRVYTLSPSGAGSSTQWTPSTGANYTTVDELPFSATDFVSDGTSGHRDLYAMADLPGSVSTVAGVQVVSIAKKSDAGAISHKNSVRSGGTNYASSAFAPTTADAAYVDLRETDPATSAAWTPSGVNAIEAGVEVA